LIWLKNALKNSNLKGDSVNTQLYEDENNPKKRKKIEVKIIFLTIPYITILKRT